jgi:hypothetical protein
MNGNEIDDLRKQYEEFMEHLKEIRLKRKEKETEWVEWAISHGGYFGDDDTNIAIFPIGDNYTLDVLKTYGEDEFVYQKFCMKINENFEMSMARVNRDYTAHSYEDLLNAINEAKLYVKRYKEIKNMVELQGDFQ